MIIVSDRKKFIFIHIPRTAGRSVSEALRMHGNFFYKREKRYRLMSKYIHERPRLKFFQDHTKALNIKKKLSTYDHYFSFTFVRNPYSWLVSVYHFTEKMYKQKDIRFSDMFPVYEQSKNFYEFAKIVCAEKKQPFFQKNFVVDENGKLIVDYIGNFENIKNDFNAITDKIGVRSTLKHTNKSSHNNYKEYYNEDLRNTVFEAFKDDFDFFGYEK